MVGMVVGIVPDGRVRNCQRKRPKTTPKVSMDLVNDGKDIERANANVGGRRRRVPASVDASSGKDRPIDIGWANCSSTVTRIDVMRQLKEQNPSVTNKMETLKAITRHITCRDYWG